MSEPNSEFQKLRHMKQYLNELKVLVGRDVERSELMPPDVTQAIVEKARTKPRRPARTQNIPFTEKSSAQFRRFIDALNSVSRDGVYIWTPRAVTCGLLPPVPLVNIRFDFDFALIPEEILTFTSVDLEDSLILDLENNGEPRIELEVTGPKWAEIVY